jgi:hypothetical protein
MSGFTAYPTLSSFHTPGYHLMRRLKWVSAPCHSPVVGVMGYDGLDKRRQTRVAVDRTDSLQNPSLDPFDPLQASSSLQLAGAGSTYFAAYLAQFGPVLARGLGCEVNDCMNENTRTKST